MPPINGLINYRIILAEDDADIRELNRRILSEIGFSVEHAFENGKDLAEFVSRNLDASVEPHLIITDLRMPLMDGIEAARTVKVFKPNVKIILTTAYDLPSKTMDLFDGNLRKPFTRNQLLGEVMRCLQLDLLPKRHANDVRSAAVESSTVPSTAERYL